MKDEFKDIRAYRVSGILWITDFLIVFPILQVWAWKRTKSLKLDYLGDRKQIEKDIKHGAFFMTNHRDIIMDAAWLSYLLRTRYFIRPYMGVGDNLFAKPWIEHVMKYLRCFAVKRGAGAHKQLENSQHLSAYIRHLRGRGKSIWLAQREGRAKDSNDLTQASVLHMLTMGDGELYEKVKALNICPVSITYEYDPCDYLKAREFQLKRDNPDYKKTREDDLQNMQTGIYGFKGRVHYQAAPPVNSWLDTIASLPKGEFFPELARRMDQEIFKGYRLFPANYAAHDMLGGSETFDDQYTPADKEHFEAYVEQQLAKIDIPHKDTPFLRERLLQMYANPLRNKLSLQS